MSWRWRAWLRRGDYVVLALALAVIAASIAWLRSAGAPTHAVVRVGGAVVGEYPLNAPRRVEVTGTLGVSVIEIAPGRARVLSDPSPRQICVRQGWLTHAGATAICAPNEVTLQLKGQREAFDSLSY